MALMHGAAANEDLPDTEILSKSDVDELFGLCLPFDSSLGMPLDELQRQLEKPGAIDETANASLADPVLFFRDHYGNGISLSDAPDWRRIDWDWMAPASSMALYLDGDINNTSLVLAIEIGEGGKVLLFPGDAQYGNWKSWVEKEGVKKLLSRTVFYKVGHHGSHNATLIDGGLSLMGTAAGFEDLVAMIPVDIQKAKSKEWEMPQSHLRDALIRQTKGRIILACEGMNPDEQCFSFDYQMPKEPPRPLKEPFGPLLKVKDKKWMDFRGAIKSDPKPDHLWVEYTLSL
jgi:hypothetical protein